MNTHGTPLKASAKEAIRTHVRANFLGTTTKVLTRIVDELPSEVAGRWSRNNDEELTRALKSVLSTEPALRRESHYRLSQEQVINLRRGFDGNYPVFVEYLLTHQDAIPDILLEGFSVLSFEIGLGESFTVYVRGSKNGNTYQYTFYLGPELSAQLCR